MERAIGRGPRTVVYEATQLSLGRRVALKLFASAPHAGELHWPEHPQVVSLYAAGPCEDGYFVAMQLIRGTSLGELLETRRPRRAALMQILRDVAGALDAAHRAGIAHGAVGARSVLVDDHGRALLSDFGLGPGKAAPGSDRADFAELVRECLGRDPAGLEEATPASAEAIVHAAQTPDSAQYGIRRRWAVVAAALVAAGAVAVLLAVSGSQPEPAPPRLPGAVAIGSALAASGVDSVDCAGREPSGASEPCIVVQTRLDGGPVAARGDGVIRRWAVRGARGELALEVLRRRGHRAFLIARTQYALVPDAGVHVLRANLPVRSGDLVGLAVAPGAAIGVRNASGATTRRRFGPTDLTAQPFDRISGTGAGQELLLRAEYIPGAPWRPMGRLTGRAAALAPAGRELDVLQLQRDQAVAVVSVRGRIAVDLFSGRRRIARIPLPGADPSGQLGSLITLRLRFGRPIVRVTWRNPDGLVSRDYAVGSSSLAPLD